tara:strand:+ start:1334 stop:1981 length:648 start_codon:yes stop_codon:yes gene_type:complete
MLKNVSSALLIIYEYYKNIDKKEILEPFCCLFRIIIFSYKEEGTKISIINNGIIYHEPNVAQGAIRFMNGDAREDLHNLYCPILKAIEWYSNTESNYKYIFQKSIIGIEKLKNVYDKQSIIYHTLELYFNLLNNHDKNIKNINEPHDIGNSPLIEQLKDFWLDKEITIMVNLLQIIETTNNIELKNQYISIAENIIELKENKLHEYIIKNSNSYG